MISTIVTKGIICPSCKHSYIWRADKWNLKMAMVYNGWLDMTVIHVARCQGGR